MALLKIDSVPVEYIKDMDDDFIKWVTNLVDILNANFEELDVTLASLDARITALGG